MLLFFLILVYKIDFIGTFKFQRICYHMELYNSLVISDDLYVLDYSKEVSKGVYILFTDEIYKHIQDGTIFWFDDIVRRLVKSVKWKLKGVAAAYLGTNCHLPWNCLYFQPLYTIFQPRRTRKIMTIVILIYIFWFLTIKWFEKTFILYIW